MGKTIAKISAVILLLSIISCRGNNARDAGPGFSAGSRATEGVEEKTGVEVVADIAQNVASPVEIATILRSMQVPYSSICLAPTGEAERLTTDSQKAIMLGIYGADLGFLNVYGETGNYIDVLAEIKVLTEELGAGEHFDFETMKDLTISKSNADSLLFLSVNSYNQIDKFLRDNDRGSLSVLMISGLWIEGQHLATQVAMNRNDEILRDRIGEQKIILGDLLMLLSPFRGKGDEYDSLYKMLNDLYSAYAGVKVSYGTGEPETIEEDDRLVMVQHEESIVEMSDKQLSEIAARSKEVRNNLISGI